MDRLSGNPSKTPSHLEGLNPEQLEAVQHHEGPLLVLAGAGSGKTRVLTVRVAHLIRHHGVAPRRILAVTFTNKAAGEMKERIGALLGREPAGMWIGTFHSMGARILRRFANRLGWSQTFTIYDQEQSLREIRRAQEDAGLDPKRWNPKAFRAHVSTAKNQLVSPQEFLEENGESFDVFTRHVARVYPIYQEALRNHDAFDFDDLLMKPVELLEAEPSVLQEYRDRFSFLLVDEYQDTNRAQYRFLELLAGSAANLMVVGDDDQSIYGWRGADIRNILDFEAAFPSAGTVRLEQNYRSVQTILEAANQVISQNVQRKGKTLRTERSRGDLVRLTETVDETDEAQWIAGAIQERLEEESDLTHSDFAVLFRTNAQARALEDAFLRQGTPYQVVGGVRFYERREIQDVLAYLRLISNPRDGGAFDRIVNYPRRGVGSVSLARCRVWARTMSLSLLEAAARAPEIPGLSGSGGKGLGALSDLIQRYSARASQVGVGALLEELVEELDLLVLLRDEGPEGDDRAENVKELIAGAHDFDAETVEEEEDLPRDRFSELDLFLQRVALVAEADLYEPDADRVTLMTLHNAKGLEFPEVFISGLEDGLFPLSRAYDEPAELEEERRLFYVGITRAENRLSLSHAQRRRRAGEYMYGRLSPFVEAISPDLLLEKISPRLERQRRTGFGIDGFGRRRRRSDGDDSWSGDPFLDQELNQDLPRFVKGERVVHPTFGSGTVQEVSGFGPDLKVTVTFDTVGRKKLLARYADLQRDFP